MKKLIAYFLLLTALANISSNCKKSKVDPHTPPDVVLKTGGNYVSGDKTVNKKDSVLVGITATKTEDDLKSYNVTPYYDGATTGTSFFDYKMNDNEKQGYSKDLYIVARNQSGSEKWVFSIVDRDGNITQKTIVLTVQ